MSYISSFTTCCPSNLSRKLLEIPVHQNYCLSSWSKLSHMYLLLQIAKWLTQNIYFLLIVGFKRSETNLASTVIWSCKVLSNTQLSSHIHKTRVIWQYPLALRRFFFYYYFFPIKVNQKTYENYHINKKCYGSINFSYFANIFLQIQ